MIQVRIRMDFEGTSRKLCDWPVTDLGRLMPAIGEWGVHTDAGDYGTGDLVGQIVVDDTSAFFEIIVVSEDDE